MLEIASQMILCLLLAALIGAIIGYTLGKSTCAGDDCTETTAYDTSSPDTPTSKSKTVASTSNHNDVQDTVETSSSLDGDMAGEEKEDTAEKSSLILLDAPRNGTKDNLTRIKGIGLKIDTALNKIGIYHFDQIAVWDEKNIAWADETLGFPGRAKREKWVEQAKALSASKETEFSQRVDADNVSSSKKS